MLESPPLVIVAKSSLQTLLALAFITVLGWIVDGLFHLCRWLPESWTAGISIPLGQAFHKKLRTRIVEQVQRPLGPFTSPEAEEAFWRGHCDHFGRCIFEGFHLVWLKDEVILDRVELVGEEHVKQALAGGKGAVLFLNHLGTPGALVAGFGIRNYLTAFAGNRIETDVAGKMRPLTRIEALVQRMFRRGRVERVLLGESLPKRMSEILKANGLFGMFVDYPVVWKNLRPIPFDRCQLTLNLGPAILALRHRVPVLAVTAVRTGLNRHRIFIDPISAPPDTRGVEAAAELMTAAIAQMLPHLREHPDQWWPWDHAPFTPHPDV